MNGSGALIVLLAPDANQRARLSALLRDAGYDLIEAADAAQASDLVLLVLGRRPDLLLVGGRVSGAEIAALRRDARAAALPVVVLGGRGVLAEVRTHLTRSPAPTRERETGFLTEGAFAALLRREVARAGADASPLWLAYLRLAAPFPHTHDGLQLEATVLEATIARQVGALIALDARPSDLSVRNSQGRFTLLLPELNGGAARGRLRLLARRVAERDFVVRGDHVRFTPQIGYARFTSGMTADDLRGGAELALKKARPGARPVLHPSGRRQAWSPLLLLQVALAGMVVLTHTNLPALVAPARANVGRANTGRTEPPALVVPAVPSAPAPAVPKTTRAAPAEPAQTAPQLRTPPEPPTATPRRAATPLARGRQLAGLFYEGQLGQLWTAFTPALRSEWGSLADFRAYRAGGRAAYGAETNVVKERVVRNGGLTYYTRRATFERGPGDGWTLILGMNAAGKVQEFGVVGAGALPETRAP